MTRGRRSRALLLATVAALLLLVATAAPASATAYRYWTYWHGTSAGGWSFSSVGATYVPPAGAVEGWRFGVSNVAGTLKPRTSASFGAICSGRSATAGNKLVALVVDYGTSADAPPHESPPRGVDTYCADVPNGARAFDVLSAYAHVRTDSGLVCGIGGYPATECGVAVQPTPSTKPTPSPRPTSPTPTHSASAPATTRPTAAGPSSSAAGPGPTPAHGSGAPTPGTTSPSGTATPGGSAEPSDTTAAGAGDGSTPSAVAVAAGGLSGPGSGGSGPPAGALVGGALVLAVAAAAAWRALRGRAVPGQPT